MTAKDKQFPLSLSSLMNKPGRTDTRMSHFPRTEMPQTAMQNAARHTMPKAVAASILPLSMEHRQSSRDGKDVEASSPLVSAGVRRAMVAKVAQQGVKDRVTLAALEAIPRHLFIESGLASQAYIDASLPIGHHQTISKPYIVARMIEIMRNGVDLGRVLEIGTGCGYQAAVLSLVAKDVYSIERIKALHELAKKNLRPMRIANIRLHYGDGMLGLPQAGPFDGIILAAAGLEVPLALLEQLAIGGRLIAPVGGGNQVLKLIERIKKDEWKSSTMEQCHFVPLRQGTI
ncbi:protein-L-isoaspartate(D-aspartate) O-methyltransferase [soil metagenome]